LCAHVAASINGTDRAVSNDRVPFGARMQSLAPRLIRLRDAPYYLGMDRNRFNTEVRPALTIVPIGQHGIAFDRLELDAWVDDYISRNGRRLKASKLEDDVCQRSNTG